MKLHIVSDGTLPGTQVFDENGEKIEGVTEIYWNIKANEKDSKCILVFRKMKVDLKTENAEKVE